MSIRNLPFQHNNLILENFEAHNSITIKEDINSVSHYVDANTGEYVIKNAGNNKILSVNMDGTLTQPSYIKTHITNAVAPVASQVGVHQSRINQHEDRLAVVEGNVGVQDISALENRIDELELYISKLQTFLTTLKAGFSHSQGVNWDNVTH